MSRRNIFEAMKREINIQHEYEKIVCMIALESFEHGTLEQVIERNFRDWSQRKNYTSFKELRNHLGFEYTKEQYPIRITFNSSVTKEDQFILFCELLLNLFSYLAKVCTFHYTKQMKDIIVTIDADLELLGYRYYRKDDDTIICILIDPAAISAAEIVDEEYIEPILEYHHHLLKGDIGKKRDILSRLFNMLEPHRKKIKKLNADLEDDVFFMLNSFNLRHNNKEESIPSRFNPAFASLNPDEIEQWYDEIYQLCLLASLLLDNEERHNDIKKIKAQNKQ